MKVKNFIKSVSKFIHKEYKSSTTFFNEKIKQVVIFCSKNKDF